jgi:CRISPR-associated protein Csm2
MPNQPYNNSGSRYGGGSAPQRSQSGATVAPNQLMNDRVDGSKPYDPVVTGENLINRLEPNSFTTSQLRKVLSSAVIVKNRIERELGESTQLSDSIAEEVQYLRVKLIYQMGRDPKIKRCFTEHNVDLPAIIKNIGKDRDRFERFFKLLESIVAFKKFKGGE